MESGELELRKAFEETSTRNIQTILEYSKETRRLNRELEEKVKCMEASLIAYDSKIVALQSQISYIQTKVFSGGTS
jgi:phage host-nuclease inhibitor protein Gam